MKRKLLSFLGVLALAGTIHTVQAQPVITTQPQAQSVNLGETATFSVAATGTEPLSHQWFFNSLGNPLPDATNATLILNNVQFNNAGFYIVNVSNVEGITRSASARLAVLPPSLSITRSLNELILSWPIPLDPSEGLFVLEETISLSPSTWIPSRSGSNSPITRTLSRSERYFRLTKLTLNNMVWIPPGTFMMGSPTNEVGRRTNEGPQTTVTISRGFGIGIYEVTQGEYLEVIGSNPSNFTGDLSRPVESVNWFAATNYCAQLTTRERNTGTIPVNWSYRLPTSAEWEYACRAGTTTRYSYGDDPDYINLTEYAWHYPANSALMTHPVGQKRPNPWGLYDMYGNVWETCLDSWDQTTGYPGGSVTDPFDLAPGSYHIIRGGGWGSPRTGCRSATYHFADPADGRSSKGFRIILAPASFSVPFGFEVPVFVEDLEPQTVTVGETVTFTVTISGYPPPFGYRWRKGSLTVKQEVTNILSSTFSITNVQLSDAGLYSVVVTNAATSPRGVLSSRVELTVEEP